MGKAQGDQNEFEIPLFPYLCTLNMWELYTKGFKDFLTLEKGLSENAVKAYVRDVQKLAKFLGKDTNLSPELIELGHLKDFTEQMAESGLSANSQSRIISGLRQFFGYLMEEEKIQKNPAKLLDLPKKQKKLPDVLTIEEINKLIAVIDLSTSLGLRNKCIIELLYASGMRVSELINYKISQMMLDEGILRIIGKGNKERLVPIHEAMLQLINLYLENWRNKQVVKNGNEDYLFLNQNGRKLTRVMIFYIIKKLVGQAGIKKNIHPHTFRHSFATHLVENGADLRVVQLLLGHENIATTEVYSHLDKSHLREALEQYHPKF